MNKSFYTVVLDESRQSLLIMDVKGYSHMGAVESRRLAGNSYAVRKVYFHAPSKSRLAKEIKETLRDSFWSSINYVEYV